MTISLSAAQSAQQSNRNGNGTYAFRTHTEALGLSLAARWGHSGVAEGSPTPWGEVLSAAEIAPGISSVMTHEGRGLKLSSARQSGVHPALARVGGFYPEADGLTIIRFTYANEFVRPDEDLPAAMALADRGLRDRFPAQWEEITGRRLAPGDSTARDAEQIRTVLSAKRCFRLNDHELTGVQRAVAKRELRQKMKRPNGSSRSLRVLIETEGISAKRVNRGSGRNSYELLQHTPGSDEPEPIPVSYSLWKAVPVPQV